MNRTKQRGASLIEAALLVALIAIVSISALRNHSRETRWQYCKITRALQNVAYNEPWSFYINDTNSVDDMNYFLDNGICR